MRNTQKLVPLSQSGHSNPSRSHSILEGLGGDSRDGVTAGQFKWSSIGSFSFSLRNQLSDPVSDVSYIVIFYDRHKQPIDFRLLRFEDTIPAGLAKRIDGGYVADSVREIVEDTPYGHIRAEDPQSGAVEFRILDFRVLK
jgi:hypothetical protein